MNQASFPLRSNKLKKKVESAVQFSGCCLSLYNPYHFWQEHQLAEWRCETGLYRVCELPLLVKKTGCSGMYAACLQSHLSYLSFWIFGGWVLSRVSDWLACLRLSRQLRGSSAISLSLLSIYCLLLSFSLTFWLFCLGCVAFITYETQY